MILWMEFDDGQHPVRDPCGEIGTADESGDKSAAVQRAQNPRNGISAERCNQFSAG
jgi:hypothetical protein